MLFRRIQSPAVPKILEPRAETFRSLGLKNLFESLSADQKYRFLDLGPAVGENIDFLSRFSSKVHVENLYETLLKGGFFELDEEFLDESCLDQFLSIPGGERFDIILSWDLVNYFKPIALRMLTRYLRAFCKQGSLFFIMGATGKEMPAAPVRFTFVDTETLLYRAGSVELRPCPRYTPRDLVLLMSGFKVQSSYILQNGTREYVFVYE